MDQGSLGTQYRLQIVDGFEKGRLANREIWP
jgi:hypothetical protein